jgi:hypothetical protein
MKIEDLINYIYSEGWDCKTSNTELSYIDFEYERSYADCVYDTLTIWKDEEIVNVSYNDIGWGYTNVDNYVFTYEEFVEWVKN